MVRLIVAEPTGELLVCRTCENALVSLTVAQLYERSDLETLENSLLGGSRGEAITDQVHLPPVIGQIGLKTRQPLVAERQHERVDPPPGSAARRWTMLHTGRAQSQE